MTAYTATRSGYVNDPAIWTPALPAGQLAPGAGDTATWGTSGLKLRVPAGFTWRVGTSTKAPAASADGWAIRAGAKSDFIIEEGAAVEVLGDGYFLDTRFINNGRFSPDSSGFADRSVVLIVEGVNSYINVNNASATPYGAFISDPAAGHTAVWEPTAGTSAKFTGGERSANSAGYYFYHSSLFRLRRAVVRGWGTSTSRRSIPAPGRRRSHTSAACSKTCISTGAA